ncbi:SEC-C metal-binding domain-containing protein [Ornithinimicrobium sp. INDO-MA30-4]|nr:SEC-C metal-binding domain-containing protein [Ornithinimicrobium sp. INDO-MA30-4]UJH69857.1 SEC-C domain-containing protein [Ornithinimicrobium sp. INDO-MA30-4]
MFSSPCPCGSKDAYSDCCQPLHLGEAAAERQNN